ncbi:MAG: diguanylate cyclase [Deltaproteobacteria bacterium]|nr:diguanylate cyclase [Deltaproteobacteria bacterium]
MDSENLRDDLPEKDRGILKSAVSLIPGETLVSDAARNHMSELKRELNQDRPYLKTVEHLVSDLRESVFQQEVQKEPPEKTTGGFGLSIEEVENRYLELMAELLIQVCGQFALYWPGELRNKAGGVATQIRQKFDQDVYYKYLENIFSLFASLREHVDIENRSRNELIKSITFQLLKFEEEFLSSVGGADEAERAQGEQAFQERMREDIVQIETAFRLNLDLNHIQQRVMQKINDIRAALTEKRKTEDDRSRKMAVRMEKLQKKLEATKEKFQRVKAQSKKAEEEAKLFKLRSMVDPLTKAFNRGAIDKMLETLMAQDNASAVMMIFDIDHFKRINDTHGHKTGDRVLQKVVEIARSSIRKDDFLGRLGGDEFLILFKDMPEEKARKLGREIVAAVGSKPFKLHKDADTYVEVSLSLGLASLKAADTAASFFERADQALYRAKTGGRNRMVAEDDR